MLFLTQTHLPVFSDPIHINPFSFLNGNFSDGRIGVAARKGIIEAAVLTTPLVRPRPKGERTTSLLLAENHIAPAQLMLYAFMKEILSFLNSPLLQPMYEIFRPTTPYTEHPQHKYLPGPVIPRHLKRPDSPHFQEVSRPPISDLPQRLLLMPADDTSRLSPQINSQRVSPVNSQMAPDQDLLFSPNPTLSTQQSNTQGRKKQKGSQQGVRRSRRIQEKNKTSSLLLDNLKKKKKVPVASIPFLPDSSQDKLDADKVLQILQATGLEITKHVEELIEDALKQDHTEGIFTQSAPATPLHNLVPPLDVPDFDLPL